MTVFRSRPAKAICLLLGTFVSISLAGLVWAQTPAENWPFEEHNQAPVAQPAPPPKSPVQLHLEELYRRDGRPLPDYMQKDASSEQAAPAPAAGDAAAQRNQRDGAAAQGTVRQQLSDYYQSQGKAIPAPQRTAGGPSASSTQTAPRQSGQANATTPAEAHWYNRINPFHRSTSAGPPQTQTQGYAPVTSAANDANHSTPAPHPAVPVTAPAATVTVQASAPPDPTPAAKSGSFWGDLTLRRVPQQPAAGPSQAAISVELGSSGRLVPKAKAPPQTAAAGDAEHATGIVHIAVVAPPVIAVPAEPQADAPAAHTVSAANAVVADDPSMPFRASSEVEADQKSESGPYTGLTLEDEQNQLIPPKAETPKIAAPTAAAHGPATVANRRPIATASIVPAAAPPLDPQKLSDRRLSDPPGHVSLPPSAESEPTEPALPQQHAVTEHRHQPQTTAEKVRLIGERVGQRGLKGFCPVVLRDQRELRDANPAYCSVYRGQKYCFSSPEAQASFDDAPRKYAPVAGGMDVVVKINSDQAVEGTLDFALWYKDRLYLFCSPESLQAFSISPTAYAAAALRIQ